MTARDGAGPRLDVELLARLEAGALDPARAALVRAAVEADPSAIAVLAALAATREELAALPLPAPPPGAVRRWLAAVRPPGDEDLSEAGSEPAMKPAPTATPPAASSMAASSMAAAPLTPKPPNPPRPTSTSASQTPASQTPAPQTPAPRTPAEPPAAEAPTPPRPTTPTPAGTRSHRQPPTHARPRIGRCRSRPRPARHPRARALVAAVLLVLAAGLLWPRPDPPRVDGVDLAAAARSAVGSSDLGALGDPVRRAGCLRATGVLGLAPDAVPLGGRRVELARGPAVLLVFATGELGVFDVVLVDPDCGPAGGTLLGTARIGR